MICLFRPLNAGLCRSSSSSTSSLQLNTSFIRYREKGEGARISSIRVQVSWLLCLTCVWVVGNFLTFKEVTWNTMMIIIIIMIMIMKIIIIFEYLVSECLHSATIATVFPPSSKWQTRNTHITNYLHDIGSFFPSKDGRWSVVGGWWVCWLFVVS